MRVTMHTIFQNIYTNLNRLTSDLKTINEQISSGKQISKPSDNPVNLANALSLRSGLEELKQFRVNIDYGEDLVNNSESSLMEMKNLIMRAKTLALQTVNAPLTLENRMNAAEEVRHIFEQTLSLANSQVGGKFIFAGHRTTGYTETEPTPFMKDYIDGHRVNGKTPDSIDTALSGTVTAGTILAGDLAVNGVPTTNAIGTGGATNGLFMDKAAAAKTEIMLTDPNVDVNLTTLYANIAATGDTANGTDSEIYFYLNNAPVTVTVPDGSSAAQAATAAVQAVNDLTDRTGVVAEVGNAANGGINNSVVFKNVRPGDESIIEVTDYTLLAGDATLGFGNFNQAADATHNTGEISLSSTGAVTLTSPNNPADDSILSQLGLGGGGIGLADEAADGALTFGSGLSTGDLLINGIAIDGTTSDGVSDVLADASAAAKAAAINAFTSETGVSAEVTPAYKIGDQGIEAGSEADKLTGQVDNTAIVAGDLAINGVAMGPVNSGAVVSGLSMDKAYNARETINQQTADTQVTANLTTLSSGAVAAAGTITNVSFDLNGVAVNFTTNNDPAKDAVAAINAVSDQTGVSAMIGDSLNGGAVGAVVLRNTLNGDESDIVISGYDGGVGTASTGLGNVTQAVDNGHNTGQITLSSAIRIDITSPTLAPPTDDILDALGLGGGTEQTGVVDDTPGDGQLSFGPTPEYLDSGDLVINGVNIFDIPTKIRGADADNALISVINGKQDQTGVLATHTDNGTLILTAKDGRNLHIETSALGEYVTHLNGGTPASPQDKVYSGSVILYSDRKFTLETTPTAVNGYEPGFVALGLDGGAATTGEPDDVAGDGEIRVVSLLQQEGSVRYTGDRVDDFAIRVGGTSNLEVGKNGQDAIMETKVFNFMREFENALMARDFRKVVSPYQAEDTAVTIDTLNTGTDSSEFFQSGSFSVTVTDHEYIPARELSVSIPVDVSLDTFDSMAEKINGIPGLNASWDSEGHLHIETDDPERYSVMLKDDSSGNFLDKLGIDTDQMQVQGLQQSIADMDELQEELTSQISDFGARANRIIVQNNIYAKLEVITTENLSEREDTDVIKALMDLKAKEVAYEAALNSAAKTMQLSLVNFL